MNIYFLVQEIMTNDVFEDVPFQKMMPRYAGTCDPPHTQNTHSLHIRHLPEGIKAVIAKLRYTLNSQLAACSKRSSKQSSQDALWSAAQILTDLYIMFQPQKRQERNGLISFLKAMSRKELAKFCLCAQTILNWTVLPTWVNITLDSQQD